MEQSIKRLEYQLKQKDDELATQQEQILNMNKEIYTLEKSSPDRFGKKGISGLSFDTETIKQIKDISCHQQYIDLMTKFKEKVRYLEIADEEIISERKRADSLQKEFLEAKDNVKRLYAQIKMAEHQKSRLSEKLKEEEDTIQALEEHMQ